MSEARKIIAFPTISEFNRILNEDEIDIVSPFYSGWALEKLKAKRHSKVRFVTRLPVTFFSPPLFLDNDPRPLRDTMLRLGSAFTVFALPNVHAKLYLTATSGWLGSANFTRTGFSGIGELLLRFTPPLEELRRTFNLFKSKATPVTADNVQFLVENVRSGLTRLSPDLDVGKRSGDASISDAVSYRDFERFLERKKGSENAIYIRQRIHNKNFMSGHAYSGFHGIFRFLEKNPAFGRVLLKLRRPLIPNNILTKVADFVEEFGDQFGGPRGGSWKSKLSVRLGGVQTRGGAGTY